MKPLTLEDAESRTLATGIATSLRTLIANGDIPPGEKLHLDELRGQFGVSLSPLREALSRLAAEGFVIGLENGRGFRVAPVSPNNLEEVTRLRAELECFALRESMRHGDERWESEVVVCLHRLGKLEKALPPGQRVEEWEKVHGAFHESLLSACRMPLLLNFCSTLRDFSDRYRRIFFENHPIDPHVVHEHREICDATLERRADQACALLREHIERTGRLVLRALSEKGNHK